MNTPANTACAKNTGPGSSPAGPATAHAGMTLVELLVALTLAVLLSILAFNLFGITQSAARIGFQRSAVLQQALAGESRLRNDFASIIGPNRLANAPAGAIVIVPALRQGTLPIPGRGGAPLQAKFRSDQLMFFYDAQNGGAAQSPAGGAPVTSVTRAGVKSRQAKIWIGHVQRASGESGSALDWSLGRQATLLVDPDGTAQNAPTGLGFPSSILASDLRATFSPANTASLTSDVAPFSLGETADWMRSVTNPIDLVRAFAVEPNNNANYTNLPVVVTQPMADDLFEAADLLGGHRLFLPHVSEMIVQYAADLDFDGLIDTRTSGPAAGTVKWYPDDADVFSGDPAAMAPKVFLPGDDQPRVIHVGYYQGPDPLRYRFNRWGDATPYPASAAGNEFGDLQPTQSAYNDAMAAYALHHNGWRPSPLLPPAQSKWPQLIRIRYRLHDADGGVGSVNESFAANQRDDDVDGTLDSPSETRCNGIWFEHLFAVPYPRTN